MKARSVIRWAASTAGAMVLTPFLQAPAAKLAEKLRFDQYLSDRWGPLMQWLSNLSHNTWYVFFAGVIVGTAIALWLALLFPGKKEQYSSDRPSKSIEKISDLVIGGEPAVLKLNFVGEQKAPHEVLRNNVLFWYVVWSGKIDIGFYDENRNLLPSDSTSLPIIWILVVVFDKPVSLKQLIAHASSSDFPPIEVKIVTRNLAIITLYGNNPMGIVDIYSIS